jgi:DNA-binding NarL/FixJ family response regulator
MFPFEPTAPPGGEAPPLKVFLADDHPIVMAGIKGLVMADPRFEVIGQASNGREVVRQVLEIRPDVLIMDISMPGLNGLQVAERLRKDCPDCRILALTVHEDRGYLRQLLAYGVSGYLLKRSAAEDLIRALTSIASGGLYLDPAIAGLVVSLNAPNDSGAVATGADLSQREEDVVRLTASGHSNKSVATELGVSVKSIETYKARAMEKLGIHTRVDLVRYAVSKGWLAV